MISVYVKVFNGELNQKAYEDIINNLDLNTLKCVCGHACLVVHGYYDRYFITSKGRVQLRILRLKCPVCHSTHAVLLSFMIPYSHVLLEDQIAIVQENNTEELMVEKIQIDEDCVRRIRRNYRLYFRERMLSFGFSFEDDVVLLCFRYFRCNFNQIRRCPYVLYI